MVCIDGTYFGFFGFPQDEIRLQCPRKGVGGGKFNGASSPKGPSAQYCRILVPKTIPVMVLGTESLNIEYLDPLGRWAWKVRCFIAVSLRGGQVG